MRANAFDQVELGRRGSDGSRDLGGAGGAGDRRSPLTGTYKPASFNAVGTVANTAIPEPGAWGTSPVTGAVIAWRLTQAEGGPFRLRVLRPTGGGYLAAASSASVTPAGPTTQTFPTALPIQAGDLIGLDNSNNGDKIGTRQPLPGATFVAWVPPLPDGATAPPGQTGQEIEVGFNAVVQPAPTLATIGPASGSVKGGTPVTITGTDFANVSGVSFGGVPATSIAVASEGQLTAIAPKAKKARAVDVTVTTVAGTTAAAKFTYRGCTVPNLSGKKLKAAKKRLRKAGCKVGKVKVKKDVTRKTGRVVKQGPKAGKVLAPGAKVRITLG